MPRRLSLGLALSVILLASGCEPEGQDVSRSAPPSAQTSSSVATPATSSATAATSSAASAAASSVGDGTLDASWVAPTTNADGSPLTDLAFYRLYYDTASTPCPASAFFQVASPTPSPEINDTVAFTLTGLSAGAQYFVAITAVDLAGLESTCSPDSSAIARSAGGLAGPGGGGIANAREHGGNALARGQSDAAIQEPVLTLTGLTADSGPRRAGTTVTFTATAAGGAAPYEFKWWLLDGATRAVLGDWSTVNTLSWTPSTPNPTSAVEVWVRNAGNTADQPGAYGTIPFAID
jgi:hypothetical protein